MGKVYLAEDLILENELVALKILREDLCRDEKHIKRFIREVQLTRKVAHPNVVRTHDIAWNDGIIYFTMEVVEGKTIKDRLHAGKVELTEVIQILSQITKGLASIHECGIIHRDLKPGNIIIAQSGVVKIADFGIARPSFTDLTQQNEVVGSAGYMAPEVWTGGDIDERSDIYSLGVLTYELIVGTLPFDGESATEVMNRHMTYVPQKLDNIDDKIPSWLAELISQMLEKDPADRPASAKEIASIIEVGSKQNHLAPTGKMHSHVQEITHDTKDHEQKEPTYESSVSLKKKIYDARSTKSERRHPKKREINNFGTRTSSTDLAKLRASQAGATENTLVIRSLGSCVMFCTIACILLFFILPNLASRSHPQSFYFNSVIAFVPNILITLTTLASLISLPALLLCSSFPLSQRVFSYLKMMVFSICLLATYGGFILFHLFQYSDNQSTPISPLGLQSILRTIIDHTLDLFFLQIISSDVYVERRAEVILLSIGNAQSIFFICLYGFAFFSYLFLLIKSTRDAEADEEIESPGIKELLIFVCTSLLVGNCISALASLRGAEKEIIFSEFLSLKSQFPILVFGGVLWLIFIIIFKSKSPDRYIAPNLHNGSYFNSDR